MPNLIGKTLGPYRILEQIGVGGMAVVYKAYQPGMDRYIAVKILPQVYSQDEQFVKRFQREARAVAKLQHAHILPVYDYGEQDGITYLTMRYVDAGTLRKRIANGPLAFDEINHFIGQIGSALDYAHRMGVVHRDVKPSNVLVDEQGNTYLTDFGVASILNATQQLTAMGVGLGTPAYISPEQGQGLPVDNRADIYSLGVILYEMVTGRVPFEAETPMAVIYKHIHAPLPLPHTIVPDLPDQVERVILKALAKAPADRFQTAGEMVTALAIAISKASRTTTQPHSALKSMPLSETSSLATQQHPAWPISRGASILVGMLLVLLALFGLLFSQLPYRIQIAGDQVQLINPDLVTETQELHPEEAVIATATTPDFDTPAPGSTPAPTAVPILAAGQGLRLDECANDLCIVHPNGVNTHLGLGNAYTNLWGSSWSPDGSRIVFAACPRLEALNEDCYDYLFIADQDGSNITLLLNDSPGKWLSPTWSPDGEWIAFAGAGLSLIRPDGSDKIALAQIPVAWLKFPIAWSPDSKQIAVLVTLQHSETGLADAVWVLNADGSGRIHAILDSDVPPKRITWTPDGQSVVVVLDNGTVYQIEAECDSQPAGCDASSRTEIESIPEYWFSNFYPQWAGESATGGLISTPASINTPIPPTQGLRLAECASGLCIVHPNGVSTPLRLGDANSNYWGATWSPDGSRLVFAACPVLEAVNQKCSAYLYIADQDGSNVTLLLNDPPGKWQSPTWSPDGEWIAYESGPGLFLIRPDGSGKQLLTQMPIAWWSKWPIAWSPDSQQIAVLVTLQNASTGKADAVWVANRDGSGEVRSIFNSDVPLTGVAWSPDGQFVAVELENGKAYKIAAKCDNQLAGCEAWAQTEIESIPEYWLPNFYPQWVSEATPPATTATTSP